MTALIYLIVVGMTFICCLNGIYRKPYEFGKLDKRQKLTLENIRHSGVYWKPASIFNKAIKNKKQLKNTIILNNYGNRIYLVKQKKIIKTKSLKERNSRKVYQNLKQQAKKPYKPISRFSKYFKKKTTGRVKHGCKDSRTVEVEQLYTNLLNLTTGLYAITSQQAQLFPNLVLRQENLSIAEPAESCQKPLPKFAECKIQEVASILNATLCYPNTTINNTSTTQSTNSSSTESPSTTPNSISTRSQRSRRSLRANQVIRNDDGSVSTIRECYHRGPIGTHGNFKLCRECIVLTVLPENRFPRYINEVICDKMDNRCFKGEGGCMQNSLTFNFVMDTNNVGRNRLGEWQRYQQTIRTKCSCQIYRTSRIFTPFVI